MIHREHPDPVERAELMEPDLAIAALVGRYVERREHHETPCVHDLLAAARRVRRRRRRRPANRDRCYEAMRADVESTTPVHP